MSTIESTKEIEPTLESILVIAFGNTPFIPGRPGTTTKIIRIATMSKVVF